MAGDWIPIRKDLDRCREVSIIVEQTQSSVNEIVGQLVRFWSWVDGETIDGWLPGATEKTLEIGSGICLQVVRILFEVKWIEIRDDGIQIVNHERWFGQNAKRRLTDAKRKRFSRQQNDSSAKRPQSVRRMSARKRTTEQKRTEQNRTEPKSESLEIDPDTTDESERAHQHISTGGSRNGGPEGMSQHPAVVLYWQRFGKVPTTFVQQCIVSTIGDDLGGWTAVLDYWELNHHRPESIGKMLDRYREVQAGGNGADSFGGRKETASERNVRNIRESRERVRSRK